jgi:hypothetical protein
MTNAMQNNPWQINSRQGSKGIFMEFTLNQMSPVHSSHTHNLFF